MGIPIGKEIFQENISIVMLEDSVHFSIESHCLVDLFKIVFDDRLQIGNIQVHLIEG